MDPEFHVLQSFVHAGGGKKLLQSISWSEFNSNADPNIQLIEQSQLSLHLKFFVNVKAISSRLYHVSIFFVA